MEEQTLYEMHRPLVKNHPILSLFNLILILGGLGLWIMTNQKAWVALTVMGALFLFLQWLNKINTTLIVTDKRTILRKGILSKYTSEIFHSNVRNIQVSQNLLQRILGIGDLEIASVASQIAGAEIVATDIAEPERVRQLINDYRTGPTAAPVVAPPPQKNLRNEVF